MSLRLDADDHDVLQILANSNFKDKAPLIDYITDNGEGRVSLSNDILEELKTYKRLEIVGKRSDEIILEEIQGFGGNSFINLLRGGTGVSYKEVVADVASKLGAKISDSTTCESMEIAILSKVIEKSWDKMTLEERKTLGEGLHIPGKGAIGLAAILASAELGGFATYRLAAVVANAVARQVIGRGLALGANAALMEGMGVLIGPIGWALMTLWLAADLAGPAYRVTVPCVIHMAYLRQKIAAMNQVTCPQGHVQSDPNAKFCSTCGAPIGAPQLRNS